jgi:hypothetical protein
LAKKRLTPRQQEWETEYKKLKRRVSDWKRKFHAVPDLPTKPERITKKDIERLKQFKWKNIPEAMKKVWRKEYEYRYENKMPEVYQPKQQYTPPTEQDYYNNPDYGDDYDEEWEEQHSDWDEPDEDDYTETVVSRDEIEAWIERTIDTITVDRELAGIREQLRELVLEASDAYGDYGGYLNYLESQAGTLTELATRAIYGYRDRSGNIHQHDESAIPQFATVLNLGRPLESSQSERLDEEGWVSFDFND